MILIITVNYNNAKLTNEMIDSIFSKKENRQFIDMIVVDNNSTDKEELKKDENVEYILLNDNIGYFPAINEGLKKKNKDYKYTVICNNDLLFEENFFSILNSTVYNTDVFAVSPRIIDLDNNDQNPSLDKKISKFKVFFYDIYFQNYYFGIFLYKVWQKIKIKKKENNLTNRRIFLGYGAIYILTNYFFINNSKLDTPPFLMGEEAFLAYQIYITNGIEFFDSNLIVRHKDHSSCKSVPRYSMYKYTKESYKLYREKLLKLPTVD